MALTPRTVQRRWVLSQEEIPSSPTKASPRAARTERLVFGELGNCATYTEIFPPVDDDPGLAEIFSSIQSERSFEAVFALSQLVEDAFGDDGAVLGAIARASSGIRTLCSLLGESCASDVRCISLYCLANLCSDDVDPRAIETKELMLECGAAHKLIGLLVRHVDGEADEDSLLAVQYAAGCLQNLTVAPEWAEAIIDAGATRHLEKLLLHSDPSVVRYISGALSNVVRWLHARSTSRPRAATSSKFGLSETGSVMIREREALHEQELAERAAAMRCIAAAVRLRRRARVEEAHRRTPHRKSGGVPLARQKAPARQPPCAGRVPCKCSSGASCTACEICEPEPLRSQQPGAKPADSIDTGMLKLTLRESGAAHPGAAEEQTREEQTRRRGPGVKARRLISAASGGVLCSDAGKKPRLTCRV